MSARVSRRNGHAEKVFLLFEEHAEWIGKGKAGVPVELGVQVAIVEDQYGFNHVAVESAINALEVHGLDRCPDHGIDGFRRYVAPALVGRNIQQLGAWVSHQAALARRRRRPRRTADPPSCRRAA